MEAHTVRSRVLISLIALINPSYTAALSPTPNINIPKLSRIAKQEAKQCTKNVGWEEEGAEETVVVVVAAVEDVVVSSESKYHQILV